MTEETKPKRKGRPLTPEEVAKLQAARRASGNLGGRKPAETKVTRAEAREEKLNQLAPRAIQVLEDQLDDPDPRIRQNAAIKVLEYRWGKPTQTVAMDKDRPMRIVYE